LFDFCGTLETAKYGSFEFLGVNLFSLAINGMWGGCDTGDKYYLLWSRVRVFLMM